MTDKHNSFRLRAGPLKAESYFAGSQDMEVVLQGRRLSKYVLTSKPEQDDEDGEQGVQMDQEATRCDLALAHILTLVDSSCKALDRQGGVPTRAWGVLCSTFRTLSEVAIVMRG